ncbi:MAG: hypothetical protein NC349_10020 [Paenibacillus sp.]|nr:hypothetical protein [Paenibacillus sp.]
MGEGIANISAVVDFHPLVTVDNNTGSRGQAGNSISDIDNLVVFMYDSDGKIIDILNEEELVDYKVVQKDSPAGGTNTDMPNDAGGKDHQGESNTSRATFTINNVPFGRYYIYCVANVGRIEDTPENREKYIDFKNLCNIEVEWNEKDISKNAQMFGYFTHDGNDTNTSFGFDAPLLAINQTRTQLHSWLKRAASKVTVLYDGSGLKEDVWIYIKSVTIKDIPRYCKIGSENAIADEKDMIVNGDSILYNQYGMLPPGEKLGEGTSNWLEISNGTPKKGAVTEENGIKVEHSEYAQSLFFYENMQGDYEGNANRKRYDKRPDWNNVGWVPKPGEYDYKDNVPYGTYIEVKAYYISGNEENVTRGDIIYRFMLGQNVTYDYNARRNHHYKVTLGFKGWANQPDWHIEYVEPQKTMYIDPSYHVSYMYNQRSVFPVRIVGDVESLDVEIVENNWAPYDPSKPDSVPDQIVPSQVAGEKDFQWNKPVYMGSTPINTGGSKYYYRLQAPKTRSGSADTTYKDAEAPKQVTPIWAGFLALNVPDELEAYILPSPQYLYSRPEDLKDFKDYYYNNKQNYRTFNDLSFPDWTSGKSVSKKVGTGNNECTIVKAADGSITVNVPMWTRPKTMLGISGFSGNNPYDTYQRKAVVRLKAKFKGDTEPVVKYMPVYQVRRVVNPKGVWRRWDDNNDFHVKLMRREGAASTTFKAFNSDGAWRAYIKTTSDGDNGFVKLVGGEKSSGDTIIGNTDTPIDFNIKFPSVGDAGRSKCAIVQVEYHGFTCAHTIYVRQGYYEPLDIVGKAKWSSFSLYNCTNDENEKKDAFGEI